MDGTAAIVAREADGDSLRLRFKVKDAGLLRFLVVKGYVTLDGASLTVTEVDDKAQTFGVMLIQHTQEKITLGRKAEGATVNVEVDMVARTVARAGKPVELTAQEFKLLAQFQEQPGRTFTREELLSGAWGYDYEGSARTVDNFVRQLRLKFEPDPEEPRHFLTVLGLGYRFDR